MTRFSAAMALAAVLSLTQTAQAAHTSVSVDLPFALTSNSVFTLPTRTVEAGDTFEDYYTFRVNGNGVDVFGAVASAKVIYKNVVQKYVAFDKIELISPTTINTPTPSVDPLPQFLFTNLQEGTYAIRVFGHAVGSMGGSYYGEMQTAAAVPEAQTLALVLAGLGVVGLMRRRA